MVKSQPKSDFKKMCVTFSILKLRKCDAHQNGIEFRHKRNGNDVKWPPPLFSLLPPLLLTHIEVAIMVKFYFYIQSTTSVHLI